jgi:hypothetical protein
MLQSPTPCLDHPYNVLGLTHFIHTYLTLKFQETFNIHEVEN